MFLFFEFEQELFPLHSSGVARETAVRADYSVAGNYYGYGVSPDSRAHRSRGAAVCFLRNRAVGCHFTVWYLRESLPYFFLKIRPPRSKLQFLSRFFSRKVAVKPRGGLIEHFRVAVALRSSLQSRPVILLPLKPEPDQCAFTRRKSYIPERRHIYRSFHQLFTPWCAV